MTLPDFDSLQTAAELAVAAFDLDPRHAQRLQTHSPTGWCLLTLLANAAAKQFPEREAEFYRAKTLLLCNTIFRARVWNGDWWATPHAYGDTYAADTAVYVETDFARFAFHCKRADPLFVWVLRDAPTSDRGWSGLSLQPYAAQLVEGYFYDLETAAQIIERLTTEVQGA